MSNTALILRDPKSPRIHVLESDGPRCEAKVNYIPFTNTGMMSFDEWYELPHHIKHLPDSPSAMDYAASIRIHALLKNAQDTRQMSVKHLRELIWRMEIMCPGCTG